MRRKLFLLTAVLLWLSAPAIASVQNLSPAETKALLEKNPEVFILDVRTLQEYQRVRLAGGRLIPIDQVPRRIGEIPTDRPILVYCAVGSRSSQVADFLERQGFRKVYNLFGGIWAWQLGRYPTIAGGP
jgi:rhodanese-related sulfurtransferase